LFKKAIENNWTSSKNSEGENAMQQIIRTGWFVAVLMMLSAALPLFAQETNPCAKEIDTSCESAKGDPLPMVDCLQSNYIDLSYDCTVKLNEFKGRHPKPNPNRSQ
jgi:hypothetical protein